MNKNILIILLCFVMQVMPSGSAAQVSFFKPGWEADTMKHAVDQLYNYQFLKARATIAPLRMLDPLHPAIQMFDCLEIYWSHFPIASYPAEYPKYKNDLKKALDYTLALLKKDELNPENTFYALLLHIMLARQLFEDGEKWGAMQHTMDAFVYIKKGFTLQDKCSEFYLTSGLYKYYREFFAEMNPVYKPLMAVFPSGSIPEGLALIEKATYTTVFVKPEAMMYASYINLRYQNDKKEGLRFASMMNTLYPENSLFKVLYTENLIQSGEYERARVELNKLVLSPVPYFKLPCALFRGLLELRYAHNTDEAVKWFELAIKAGQPISKATENFVGLAYYELAHIYKQKGNMAEAKNCYKKAEQYCQYVTVKKDAAKRK
ncbi:MAG: tetratricopeptide repeat protein [Bacteroidota bacterium]